MRTELKGAHVMGTTSNEFTSAEYVLLLGSLIVTCAAASHFVKELLL